MTRPQKCGLFVCQMVVFPELQPLFQKTLGVENRLFHEEYVLAEFMKNRRTPKVGLFHAGTRQMILTKSCTEIVAFHEMCHLKHFEEVGEIAYRGFNRLEKVRILYSYLLLELIQLLR